MFRRQTRLPRNYVNRHTPPKKSILSEEVSMRLAPGSVRNWATAEDDEYIKEIKRDLQLQLRRQKQQLCMGCNPYGVGCGVTITDVKDWNRRNPNFAIPLAREGQGDNGGGDILFPSCTHQTPGGVAGLVNQYLGLSSLATSASAENQRCANS